MKKILSVLVVSNTLFRGDCLIVNEPNEDVIRDFIVTWSNLNASSCTDIGNQTYCDDGSSETRIGNQTYKTDKSGNTTSCSRIGNTEYCN